MADLLNAQQLEAVESVQGPILVVAGAGSGKTRVITRRIAHLMTRCGVSADRILAVTFTNKAAEEMKQRVTALADASGGSQLPLLCTFHSLCVRILRRHIDRLGGNYTRNFTIYDQDDQARLVRSLMKELGVDDNSITVREVLSAISWAKNRNISPAAYAVHLPHAPERAERIARVFKVFEERLHQSNALDFDDLLLKSVALLRRNKDVCSYYHDRFRHVMIDEFQDTNQIQYELARLIAVGPGDGLKKANHDWAGRSFCVVGDVDQSIYGFRGSDFNIILGFKHDFEGTRSITLEQNYRSTQMILDAANAVIERNKRRLPKNLLASKELGPGEKIAYYQSYDGEGEAAFVAEQIDRLLRTTNWRCAVLYRTNAQSRLFEESLRRRGIAYNMVGGFSFYERAEIKDVIAYLRLCLNPSDDLALLRVINSPHRGIGKATLDLLAQKQAELGLSLWDALGVALQERLLQTRALNALSSFRKLVSMLHERCSEDAAEAPSVAALVKTVIFKSGYAGALKGEKTQEAEGRLLNLEELGNAAAEADQKGESLLDFIDHAALVADTDQYRSDARVTLMTMHSAKGLEFPVVFIVGLEENLFPHFRAASGEADEIEEERRLCYVAITRAQKRLYLTNVIKRHTFGEEIQSRVSRFLKEIPEELLEDLSLGASWKNQLPEPAAQRRAATATFQRPKNTSTYKGKTYDSAEGVFEFLSKRAQSAPSQSSQRSELGEFPVGSRVSHDKYGYGIVLDCEGSGDEAKLTINFPGYGRKKFIAGYATLKRV